MATELLYDFPPPPFNAKHDNFQKWERKFNLWLTITDIPKEKRAAFLVLNLDEDTQDIIFDTFSESHINQEEGVNTILCHLRNIFKKDEALVSVINHSNRDINQSYTLKRKILYSLNSHVL